MIPSNIYTSSQESSFDNMDSAFSSYHPHNYMRNMPTEQAFEYSGYFSEGHPGHPLFSAGMVSPSPFPQPQQPQQHHLAGSPEIQHLAHFQSSLSSASGQSATSSALGSPYSNHATIQSSTVPEWPIQGLGLQPAIASYDNGFDFTFGGASIEHEFAYPAIEMNKPIGFVGESTDVSDSSNHHQLSSKPSISAFIACMERRGSEVDFAPPSPAVEQGTKRPLPMSPPSMRKQSRATFQFISESPGASHRTSISSPSGQGFSPNFGGQQQPTSAGLPCATSAASPYKCRPPVSSFFSQSSGHFLPPFSFPGRFPVSLSYCQLHSLAEQSLILNRSINPLLSWRRSNPKSNSASRLQPIHVPTTSFTCTIRHVI